MVRTSVAMVARVPARRIETVPFAVDAAFQELSYARRYEEACMRLVRERLYDAACFFTSSREAGRRGQFSEPNAELSIQHFAISLHARAAAFATLPRKL